MKKSHIIGGIIGLAVVVGLGVYMKSKPASVGGEPVTVASEAPAPSGDLHVNHETGTAVHATDLTSKAPINSNDPKMKKIEAFLTHSRVLDEFKAMDELLEAQLEQIQDASQLSPSDHEDLDQLRKIVSSEKLLADYKKLMNEKFSEQELDKLNEIYQEPAVAKYKDAQVYNQTPEGQKELIEYWKNFKVESLSADRLAAIKDNDKAMGATENTVKMIESVADMSSKGGNKDDPALKKEKETFQKSIHKSVEDANVIQISKNLKDESVDAIRGLNKTLSDATFQKELQVKNVVLTGAMKEVTSHIDKTSEKHQQDSKKPDADKKK